MRKFWLDVIYDQPYPNSCQDEAAKSADRIFLRKLVYIIVVVTIFVLAVMAYRHLQGWQVIQD